MVYIISHNPVVTYKYIYIYYDTLEYLTLVIFINSSFSPVPQSLA